jgi:hypothetical protein
MVLLVLLQHLLQPVGQLLVVFGGLRRRTSRVRALASTAVRNQTGNKLHCCCCMTD